MMEERKTLYRLEDYWVNTLLESAKLLSLVNKKPTDLKDFVHIGDDTYIDVEDLLGWIENLNYELDHAREEKEDLEKDLEDNYVPRYKDAYEEYGVSPRDFI